MRRFVFTLALALGKTVAQLLSEISSRELTEWVAFNNISPIGEERGDARQAFTTAAIVNAFRGKNSQPAKPAHFMPWTKTHRKRQTVKQQMGVAKQAAAILGKLASGDDQKSSS